jgi:hypothetical protein
MAFLSEIQYKHALTKKSSLRREDCVTRIREPVQEPPTGTSVLSAHHHGIDGKLAKVLPCSRPIHSMRLRASGLRPRSGEHPWQQFAALRIMMGNSDAKSKAGLGFLTVVDHPQHGLCGGYLILNRSGRPLEFHCTTPVRPNRAQEILYGPTLKPFLYGEQIGQALLSKSKSETLVICTDQEAALAVADYTAVPVVLVLGSTSTAGEAAAGVTHRLDAAHPANPVLHCFRLGENELALPQRAAGQVQQIAARLDGLAESFDLAEPFTRIREAIEEAQRAAR